MTKFYTGTLILLFALASAQAQWSPVGSGTPNELRSVQFLDSGVGLDVGDGGAILKTLDLGASWSKGPRKTRSFRAKRSAAEESLGVSFEVSPRDPSTPPPAALGMTLFSSRPLSGGAGNECRLASGNYPTLVLIFGAPVTSLAARMSLGMLLDSGVVYDSDSQETKRNVGEIIDNSNFREDLNADGRIDRNDTRLARRKIGSTLLP